MRELAFLTILLITILGVFSAFSKTPAEQCQAQADEIGGYSPWYTDEHGCILEPWSTTQ